MLFRIVSSLLLVIIVVCPVCCGSGWCLASQCCDSPQTKSLCVETRCCHDADNHQPNHNPEPAPSSCRGFCGAVVVEKPREIGERDGSFLFSMTGKSVAGVSHAPPRSTTTRNRNPVLCGGNFGRSLRTLHMSFLC